MSLEVQPTRLPKRPVWLLPLMACLGVSIAGAAYFAFGKTSYAVLFSDLRAADAAAVVEQLKKEGVAYRLSQGGATILVPEAKRDTAQLAIAGSGLTLNGLDGFELFNNSDMGLTDFAQKIKYQRALQGELARTIMMMEGVKEARVHLAIPERSVFRGEQLKGKAAVSIIWRAPQYETNSQVWGVQRLVASSVPGLSDADVTVLNGRGQMLSSGMFAKAPSDGAPTVQGNYVPSQLELREIVGRTLSAQAFDVALQPMSTSTGPSVTSNSSEAANGAGSLNRIIVTTREALDASAKNQIATDLFIASVIGEGREDLIAYQVNANLAFSSDQIMQAGGAANPRNLTPARNKGAWIGAIKSTSVLLWVGALCLMGGALVVLYLGAKRLLRPQMSAQAHAEFAEVLKQEFEARFKGASQDAS
jgi:flagellar M-ring protein FliF